MWTHGSSRDVAVFGNVAWERDCAAQPRVFSYLRQLWGIDKENVMTKIPLELYRLIVGAVAEDGDEESDSCLIHLAIVSRAFQSGAERFLYRNIVSFDLADLIDMCKRICRTPRFAAYIRCIDADNAGSDYTICFFARSFYRLLSRTLELTTRLEVRRLPQRDPPCSWILNRCTFQLSHFSSLFPFDANLIGFLERQFELTELYARRGYNEDNALMRPLPQNAIPKLTVLIAIANDMENILPGRPVTHIRLYSPPPSGTLGSFRF
jgi:hypothetical protein